MKNIFRKRGVPGPNTFEEARKMELNALMKQWYAGTQKRDFRSLDTKHGTRTLIILFALFIVTLFLAGGVVYFTIEGKTFSLSREDETVLDPAAIEISTPELINSGDTITIGVAYSNQGRARLTDAVLTMRYPDNFLFMKSSPLTADTFEKNVFRLLTIEPFTSGKIEITGQVLGPALEEKEIRADLTYKPTNFHSTFRQESIHRFTIQKSLFDVRIDVPNNLLQEQDVEVRVTVLNTSELELHNVVTKIAYPEQFVIKEMPADLHDNKWVISKFAPADEKTLILAGYLKSQTAELREFKAEVGIEQEGVFVLQNQAVRVSSVIDPKVNIYILAQNEGAIQFGDTAQIEIIIANLSTLDLEQGVLTLKIEDPQELLKFETLRLIEEYDLVEFKHEKKSGSEDSKVLADNARYFTISNLLPIEAAGELALHFLVDVIEVPYDIGASDFVVSFSPSLSTQSKNITVPLFVEGDTTTVTIAKQIRPFDVDEEL